MSRSRRKIIRNLGNASIHQLDRRISSIVFDPFSNRLSLFDLNPFLTVRPSNKPLSVISYDLLVIADCSFSRSIAFSFSRQIAICLLSADNFRNIATKVADETGKRKASGIINKRQFGVFHVFIWSYLNWNPFAEALCVFLVIFGGHLNAYRKHDH